MYDTAIAASDFPELFAQASEQAGYFTAQAHAAGYSKQLLAYHAATGRFIRQRRGLYRLRDYPSSRYKEVTAAWLAAGKNSAAVSHESALDLLNLSDVLPDRVHLTVPRSRRGLPRLRLVALHTTVHPLLPHETTIREGIRITDPMRSILRLRRVRHCIGTGGDGDPASDRPGFASCGRTQRSLSGARDPCRPVGRLRSGMRAMAIAPRRDLDGAEPGHDRPRFRARCAIAETPLYGSSRSHSVSSIVL